MKLLFIIVSTVLFGSCSSNEQCIPIKSSSYLEAISEVQGMKFSFTDELPIGKSSWINGADYYSCDGNKGYLILKTNNQEYIHEGVPKDVWIEFKNAESSGSYYDENIKYHYSYQLKIK